MIHTKVTSEYGGSAIADSNGNVRSIIRNIVRDWAVEAMLLFIYSDRLPDIYDVMGSTPMCSYTVMVHCTQGNLFKIYCKSDKLGRFIIRDLNGILMLLLSWLKVHEFNSHGRQKLQ
ncbi:hypothetical protein P8452_50503 [Trifolium repens]|nr:hypothetical protein P8452_50503 [Trifolium repens]